MPSPCYAGLHPNQRRFLLCFEQCASVLKAARWAGVNRITHYGWMKESPAYVAAFEHARTVAVQALEDEAVRRGREGVRKAVWYKGKIVGYETEYSDTLLVVTLKGWAPERYRERSSVELGGKVGVDLTALRKTVIDATNQLTAQQRIDTARKLLADEAAQQNGKLNGHSG